MKITPVNSIANSYTKLQAYSAKATQQTSMGEDTLELSEQARLFTEAFAAAKRQAPVGEADNSARVAKVMQEIEQGSYHVDVNDICNKILG